MEAILLMKLFVKTDTLPKIAPSFVVLNECKKEAKWVGEQLAPWAMKNFEFRLSPVNAPWVLISDSLAKTESDFVKSS